MRGNFDNSGKFIRFIFRRERIVSTVWLVCLLSFSISLAPAIGNMFTDEARSALAVTLQNPGMIAMMGPVYGADNYTTGAMYSNTMLLWVIIIVAIMNIFLVIRHTRSDEEKGRAELVRSLPTGRLSILNSTMIVAAAINTVLALLTGLGLAAAQIPGMGFTGSMLYGIALGISGMFFAAVAALFSQLSSSSRGAAGFSFLILGLFYMIRAAGDLYSETLSLISPLGLVQRSQIYVENHWWPVVVILLETAVITVVSYMLNSLRDIEQGFIPAKPGRKEASILLQSTFGLSLKLLWTSLLIWFVGIFAIAASYGSIMGDIETFVSESEFYQAIIGVNSEYSIAMMFTAMVNSIMSLISLIPVLIVTLKTRNEEKEGRTEHVLARVVSRSKYLAGYSVLAFTSSVLFQCATVLGFYMSSSTVLTEPLALGFLLKSSMVYLPALWIMIGITILLIGLLPKAAGAVWAYYCFSFFTDFFGRVLDLPKWLSKVSPFGYIPQLPVDSVNYYTLAILTIITVILTTLGFISFRKRDIQA